MVESTTPFCGWSDFVDAAFPVWSDVRCAGEVVIEIGVDGGVEFGVIGALEVEVDDGDAVMVVVGGFSGVGG